MEKMDVLFSLFYNLRLHGIILYHRLLKQSIYFAKRGRRFCFHLVQEKFKNTRGVIRNGNSKKGMHYNGP
jgi:hypothetical protein